MHFLSNKALLSMPIPHPIAYAAVIITMAIWGSSPVAVRAVVGDVPPLALSFARWLIACLVLLPFIWRKLPAEWRQLRHKWQSLMVMSTLMTAGSSLAVVAVYYTSATNAVIVNAAQPAITAVIAWLVVRDVVSFRQGTGVICAFIGIVVMISRADLAALVTLDINVGDPIMFIAVVGWSLYAVYLHRQDHLPSADVLLFVIALTGAVILLPFYLIEAKLVGAFELSASVVSTMIYLAVFPTLLATFFWNFSVRSLGANRATIFINLIPVFGAAFAMIFLGEELFFYHVFGASFVFIGILLSVRKEEIN